MMKNAVLSLLIAGSLFLAGCGNNQGKEPHVMVVAGGHAYDTAAFVEMFRSLPGITFDTVMQPRANRLIAEGKVEPYDVIVFYDMWNGADSGVREGYQELLEQGKGMVFLHHSLAGYPQWEGFRSIIGGKYYTPESGADSVLLSTYRHDINIGIRVTDPDHPVTSGVPDFRILDEGYGNISVDDDVVFLLEADHPDCYPGAGWTHQVGKSEIVYLMPGHDRHTYENEHYRSILGKAIVFAAR